MAKPSKADESIEAVREAAADVPSTPKIVLDGIEYDASNLTDPAKGIVSSLQFADSRLLALHNELAVCQTAYASYLTRLKSELGSDAS